MHAYVNSKSSMGILLLNSLLRVYIPQELIYALFCSIDACLCQFKELPRVFDEPFFNEMYVTEIPMVYSLSGVVHEKDESRVAVITCPSIIA